MIILALLGVFLIIGILGAFGVIGFKSTKLAHEIKRMKQQEGASEVAEVVLVSGLPLPPRAQMFLLDCPSAFVLKYGQQQWIIPKVRVQLFNLVMPSTGAASLNIVYTATQGASESIMLESGNHAPLKKMAREWDRLPKPMPAPDAAKQTKVL